MDNVKIEIGDCLDGLCKLESNSVDCVVTDPPYGYSLMNKDWDKTTPSVDVWKECFRVLKPGAFAFIMSAPRTDVQTQMANRVIDAGFRTDFTPIYWTYLTGFPKGTNMAKAMEKKNPDMVSTFDGSYAGYQPKPAVEVVLVAMKPLSEKTYVEQALSNGKGVTWIEDCRIPFDGPVKRMKPSTNAPHLNDHVSKGDGNLGSYRKERDEWVSSEDGKFPANLLVSDNALNDGTSDGEYSKYFSVDNWWDNMTNELPESVKNILPFMVIPKASKSEKNAGCDNLEERKKWLPGGGGTGISDRESVVAKNFHPTCKPLKLMSYLITLGTRVNDVVLDPFAGSGTTLVAAKLLNRKAIGFELSEEYGDIIRARMSIFNQVGS